MIPGAAAVTRVVVPRPGRRVLFDAASYPGYQPDAEIDAP